jgi:hypothetical protein
MRSWVSSGIVEVEIEVGAGDNEAELFKYEAELNFGGHGAEIGRQLLMVDSTACGLLVASPRILVTVSRIA